MTKMKLICLVASVLTLLAGVNPAFSIPDVSGVSGTVSSGQTVTVYGSGFDTKIRQQPLLFDDISSISAYQPYLQNNTVVPTRGCLFGATTCEDNPQPDCAACPWYNHWYGAMPRFYIGANSRYSGHPAYRATNLTDTFTRSGCFARDFAVNASQGWTTLDWWIRSNGDFGNQVSGKILRLWHNPNLVDQIVIADIGGAQLVTEMHNCGYNSSIPNYFSNFPDNQWIHLQVQTHVSSAENKTWVLMDGKLVASSTDVCGNDGIYDYLRMVGLDPSIPENLDPSLQFLWGDVYFDDSLARVIVADSSTFNPLGNSAAVHYEMQNVQSWADSSISLKFNPGSFSAGQTVYLYVVDAAGNINSSGRPVVIGGAVGPDTTSPSAPANLRTGAP